MMFVPFRDLRDPFGAGPAAHHPRRVEPFTCIDQPMKDQDAHREAVEAWLKRHRPKIGPPPKGYVLLEHDAPGGRAEPSGEQASSTHRKKTTRALVNEVLAEAHGGALQARQIVKAIQKRDPDDKIHDLERLLKSVNEVLQKGAEEGVYRCDITNNTGHARYSLRTTIGGQVIPPADLATTAGQLRAILAQAQRPMYGQELADALNARGWQHKGAPPTANMVSQVISGAIKCGAVKKIRVTGMATRFLSREDPEWYAQGEAT